MLRIVLSRPSELGTSGFEFSARGHISVDWHRVYALADMASQIVQRHHYSMIGATLQALDVVPCTAKISAVVKEGVYTFTGTVGLYVEDHAEAVRVLMGRVEGDISEYASLYQKDAFELVYTQKVEITSVS